MREVPAYVYILQSEMTRRYYIGSAFDPHKRLGEHNRGENTSTRGRGPWQIVRMEAYPTLSTARRRERELKAKKSARYLSWLCGTGPVLSG